jgi:predicted Rossmann-fold nucleotide-binding protein
MKVTEQRPVNSGTRLISIANGDHHAIRKAIMAERLDPFVVAAGHPPIAERI